MRSRTSRGVPEWSGGKDLYMGSLILVAGKVSHFIRIVPGVPKGVRGSTKGVHLPRGCWKYALEAIIKVLLYFNVHDKCLLFML